MGFCRKAPPIEDVFGSYKLEKKKKKENKLRFPSPSPAPEIMEEATATSFPGFSPTRFTERARERENLGTRLKPEDVPFFHSSLLTRELIKAMKKKCHFFLPLHSLVRTKTSEYKSVGFF